MPFTVRVMWAWSAKPHCAAISTSAVSVPRIALHACRARARARNAHGEIPNTLANARDTVHAEIPLVSLQDDRFTEALWIRALASSSGQSWDPGSCSSAEEISKAAAAHSHLSTRETTASGSVLPNPNRNAYSADSGTLRTLAPEIETRSRCASKAS